MCDEEFKFIAGFLRSGSDPQQSPLYYSLNQSYLVSKTEIVYIDETVIFGGVLVGHFGHFILESMGRLWYVLQNEIKNIKIVFTTILSEKKWFWDFFELLGIDADSICFIDRPTQYAEVIVPEESIHSWDSYTKEYLLPYKKILNSITIQNYKKVYLTRTKLEQGGAQCCNEQYFENYYKEKGFTIIAPEHYTIYEQIAIVAGADEIVTTLGSLSHFAMFCKNETKFTILTRVDDDILPAQCLVNEASGINWYIVDVSLNFLFATRAYGVNQIGITKYWKQYIKDLYGETVENNTIQDSCFEYLVKWCEFYSSPHQYKKLMHRDLFYYFNKLHRVLRGYDLNKKKYPIEMSYSDLMKKIAQQEDYIRQLEQDKIESLRMQSCIEMCQRTMESIRYGKGLLWNLKKKFLNDRISSTLRKMEQDRIRPVLFYEIHASQVGWEQRKIEGLVGGDITKQLPIEAIKIYFDNKEYHIYYSTCSEIGKWDDEVADGQLSGTVGKHMPLKGVRIRSGKLMQKDYQVLYRIYDSSMKWSEWKSNNEENCVQREAAIEAIQIKIK